MTPCRTTLLIGIAALVISGCGDKAAQEEKIRITIEKPSEKVAQKPAPLPQEQPKPAAPEEETKKTVAEPPARKKPMPAQQEVGAAGVMPSAKEPVQPRPTEELVGERIDFRKIAEYLNLDTRSKEQIKLSWNKFRGRTIMLDGEVVRVQTGRKGFKMLVNNTAAPSAKGYNIVLVGSGQEERLQSLSPGNFVRFRGTVIDFDAGKKGFGPVLILRNGQVL